MINDFVDDHHAFATGLILGALQKSGEYTVLPVTRFEGSLQIYTPQLTITIDGKPYLITITPDENNRSHQQTRLDSR
jgi:hypothetical protein